MKQKLSFKNRESLLNWCIENLTNEEKAYLKKRSVKTKKPKFGKNPIEIFVFDNNGLFLKRCDSILDAAKNFNISRQAIRYCLNKGIICENRIYFSTTNEFSPKKDIRQRAKYAGWNNKKVFVFDLECNLIIEHESVVAAAKWVGLGNHHIYRAIQRENVVKSSYYFSYQREFKIPKVKKYNRNPLLRPVVPIFKQD